MYGADPRLAAVRDQDRLPAAVRRGGRPRIRSAARTCTDLDGVVDALVEMRAAQPAIARRDRQAQRRRLRPGQRASSTSQGLPAPGSPDERGRAAGARRGDGSSSSPASTCASTSRSSPSDGGIVEERIVRRRAAQPERAAAGHPARRGRAALDPRPAARRAERADATSAAGSPPTSAYARAITARRRRSASGSPREGVLGRFAVDFVVVRDAGGGWTPYAIEINLRKGGTTHPFLTLQFLTDGTLRPGDGALHRAERAREAPRRDATTSSPSSSAGSSSTTCSTSRCGTACTSTRRAQTGVVFHMMSALTELGRIGDDRGRRHARAGGRRLPARRARAGRGGGAAAGAAAARGSSRARRRASRRAPW